MVVQTCTLYDMLRVHIAIAIGGAIVIAFSEINVTWTQQAYSYHYYIPG